MPVSMSDHTLDCLGLKCPLPVLKARKHLSAMRAGEILCVLADDPIAPIDLEFMVKQDGHRLLELATEGDQSRARIEKGSPRA